MIEMECRKIYREAFGDDEIDFENRLFKYCGKYIKTLEVDNKTVAMLFAMPVKAFIDDKALDATYVYGVATGKAERSKGYMSKLFNSFINSTDNLIFLKPANESLFDFYGRFGMKKFVATTGQNKNKYILPCEDFKLLADTEANPKVFDYTAMYIYNGDIDLNGVSFPNIIE